MSTHQTVALTAAGGFGVIVAFQVALALGAPLGGRGVGRSDHPSAAGHPPGRQRGRVRDLGLGRGHRSASRRVPRRGVAGRPHLVGDLDPRRRPRPRRGHELRVRQPLGAYGGGPFTLVLAGLCLVVARMPATAPP